MKEFRESMLEEGGEEWWRWNDDGGWGRQGVGEKMSEKEGEVWEISVVVVVVVV